MKARNFLIALAIFGGTLFTAQATHIIDLNDQVQTQIDKRKIKISRNG